MFIINSAVHTAARSIRHAPSYHAQRRHLFRLPDLSSFPSPFADSASVKPQTYHEHKVLPCVRAARLGCGPSVNSMSLGTRAGSCTTSSLTSARMHPSFPSARARTSGAHSPPSTTIPPRRRCNVARCRWRRNSPSLSWRSRSATRAA